MIFSPANIMTQLSASERVGYVLFCEVRNGEPNRGGSTDQKNQFAAKVARLTYFVRGRGVAELVACHFRRTDSPHRYQRHNAFEMLSIASDAGAQSNDIAAVWLRCLCARGNEGRPATYFQHFERPLRYISADSVKYR